MIIMHIMCGMGNQMFQYAVGRCLAHRRNTELKLDITQCEKSKDSRHSFYRLNEFNIKESIATPEEIRQLPLLEEYNIKETGLFLSKFFNAPDNIKLKGYWENEKYFNEIRDILLKEFTLKNPLGKVSATWKEKILNSKCAVSLHVRHGDYFLYRSRIALGLVPIQYYYTCVNTLHRYFPDMNLFVFSDDLKWCKENLKFDLPTEFVEGCERDSEEIYLMSLCQHNIIPNSTFAWWGAWLNQNPDKKILAPVPFFLMKFDYPDAFVPESWIKIPVDYSINMSPILSVVVYIENDMSHLEHLLKNIFSMTYQGLNFGLYEVILIDASTDGTGEALKQIAVLDNVVLLKPDISESKYQSLNKSINVARGDYILFLSSKDIIFPNTAEILRGTSDNIILRKTDNRQNYSQFENFQKLLPNIICSTPRIEEETSGTIVINEMPNKKFSFKVDPALQNLGGTLEFQIPKRQKLLLLAAEQINNSVGTKFFKRSFLNENNIRFRTGGGMDSELLFLVETFLCTEKITFTPQVFYGRLK